MAACDSKKSNDKLNTKSEWISLKKEIDSVWNDYTNKKNSGPEVAKKFIEYADQISNSEIIPPLVRYEESMRLYNEALTQVENEKVEKRLTSLNEMYSVGNLNLSKVTAEIRKIEKQESKIKKLEEELKYQKALSKFKDAQTNRRNTYVDTRCRTCGGDGTVNCWSHDTDGNGYCTDCNNSGFTVCYHCGGSGRQ